MRVCLCVSARMNMAFVCFKCARVCMLKCTCVCMFVCECVCVSAGVCVYAGMRVQVCNP